MVQPVSWYKLFTGSARPPSRRPEENPPWIPPTKAPPVPPPPQQKYDERNDPWAAPIPEPTNGSLMSAAKLLLLNYQPRWHRAVVPKRNKMTMPTALEAARETLSHYVPTTVEPVPRPVPPPAIPVSTDISMAVAPPVNMMTQSWQFVSGFPATPSPPLLPPDLADCGKQKGERVLLQLSFML